MLGALFTSRVDPAPLSLTSLIWGTSAAVTSSLCFLLRGVSEKCFIQTKEGDCCYSKADIWLKVNPSAIYLSLGICLLSPSTTLCSLAKKPQGHADQQTLLLPSHLPGHHRIYLTYLCQKGKRLMYLPSTVQFRAAQQASFRQVKERNNLLHVFRLAGQLTDCWQHVSPGSLLTAWYASASFSASEARLLEKWRVFEGFLLGSQLDLGTRQKVTWGWHGSLWHGCTS